MSRPAIRIILKPLGRENAHGMQQGRTIWIDPRTPRPAYILMHELIHLENPSWSETAVRQETAKRWRKADWREKARLLRLFGAARVGEESE